MIVTSSVLENLTSTSTHATRPLGRRAKNFSRMLSPSVGTTRDCVVELKCTVNGYYIIAIPPRWLAGPLPPLILLCMVLPSGPSLLPPVKVNCHDVKGNTPHGLYQCGGGKHSPHRGSSSPTGVCDATGYRTQYLLSTIVDLEPSLLKICLILSSCT